MNCACVTSVPGFWPTGTGQSAKRPPHCTPESTVPSFLIIAAPPFQPGVVQEAWPQTQVYVPRFHGHAFEALSRCALPEAALRNGDKVARDWRAKGGHTIGRWVQEVPCRKTDERQETTFNNRTRVMNMSSGSITIMLNLTGP